MKVGKIFLLMFFLCISKGFCCNLEHYDELNRQTIKNLDYKGNIRLNSACIAKDPDSAAVYYYHRAYAYRRMKKYESALKDYRKVVALKPDFVAAYVSLARLNNEMGDYNKAIARLDKAISLEPKNPSTYNVRGNFKMMEGDYKAALADFRHAKELGLNTKNLDYNIRTVLYYMQNPPEKQRVLPSYIETTRTIQQSYQQ